MFNLTKMNVYKTLHMKSFYILPLIMAVICFAVVGTVYSLSVAEEAMESDVSVSEEFSDVYDEIDNIDDLPAEVNTESTEQAEEEENTLVSFFDNIVSSGFFTMIFGLGVAFIASSDYKHGFIKNYAGQVSPKGIGPIAKIPAAIIEMIFMLAVVLGALALCGNMFYDDFAVGSVSDLFKVVGMQIFLCTAYSSILIFFASFTRSSVLAIVVSIYLSSGLPGALINLINSLLNKYMHTPESFDLGSYTIERYTMTVTSGAKADYIGYAAIVAAVYLIVSSVASFVIVKKRDV